MSDLIVIGYPDEKTAQNVWEELVKLERDYLVEGLAGRRPQRPDRRSHRES